MKTTLQLNTEQLMDVIKILPYDDKYFLKTYIEKELLSTYSYKSITDKLLYGPTMSDEQFQLYQQTKDDFAQWTRNL
jgi:hypothetical protein